MRSGWSGRGRFVLTTLAKAAVCLRYVVVLNKHCSTRVHTHTYLCTHTEAACSCVLVRSRASLCGLVGFSNTHALCLCCAQRPPVVWASHNLPLPPHQRSPSHRFFLCLFPLRITLKILIQAASPPLASLSPSFNVSIPLKKQCSVYVLGWQAHRGFRRCPGHRFVACGFCALRAASTHFLTLLISPFHNLPRSLPPNSVWCVSFCSLLLEASEFTGGARSAWKHKRGSAWSQPSVTDTITPAAEAPMC